MIDPHNIYFYLIFIVQIFLISWYFPQLIVRRMQTVLEKYPASEFPKLYTKPEESFRKKQNNFAKVNQVLLVVGFSLLSAIVMWDYKTNEEISPMVPWAYFMLQMMPMMWLEVSEYKYFKSMREADTSTRKAANIRPRHLFDFISKRLLITALAFMAFAFAMVLLNYGLSSRSFENIIIILATNTFFAAMIYWVIYGRKLDPYQANKDRLQGIKVTVKTGVYISIAVSAFLAVQMVMKIYGVSFLKPVVMSLYCQLIVWFSTKTRLNHLKLENIDFSVYKASDKQIDSELS